MSLFLVADHGDVVSAIPFVAPMLLLVGGLLFLVLRDRFGSRRDADPGEKASFRG